MAFDKNAGAYCLILYEYEIETKIENSTKD